MAWGWCVVACPDVELGRWRATTKHSLAHDKRMNMKNLKQRIHSLGAVVWAVALASPVAVSAQAPARADLVGTWVAAQICCTLIDSATGRLNGEGVLESILMLKADSTWRTRIRVDGVEDST